MISTCTRLGTSAVACRQRWSGQHIAGMMHSSAIPMIPRLEWSTGVVDATGGDRCLTTASAESMCFRPNSHRSLQVFPLSLGDDLHVMVQSHVGELNELFLYGYPIRQKEGYSVVWLSSEFM